jgi:hypothetical protein
MWTKIKWGLRILVLLIVGLFLHYTLPQRDIVQIVNTYNRVTPIGGNWMFYGSEDTGTGAETSTSRDIRFIDAVYPDGRTMTYRNEDTGWFWPPYFKWDSSTLQAEATTSARNSSQWVAVTHYGWRMPIISIYPNAVKVTPVEGPDATFFPWLNLVIISFLLAGIFMIRRMWLQFRERMVDPTLSRAGDALGAVGDRAEAVQKEARGFFGRIGAWANTWRAKKK